MGARRSAQLPLTGNQSPARRRAERVERDSPTRKEPERGEHGGTRAQPHDTCERVRPADDRGGEVDDVSSDGGGDGG